MRVITIDGPSGAGKSTVARELARRIGFEFLDTGALYRAVALYLLRRGIKPDASDDTIRDALHDTVIIYECGRVFINGEDVSTLIRTPEISHYSSVFSARKPVRDYLIKPQKEFARRQDCVVEGRDTGTVVFPDAWAKFYLDASDEVRIKRRYNQLRELGKKPSKEEVEREVRERDERDSKRALSPLKIPPEAHYIDTSDKDIEEVIERILSYLRSADRGV